MPRSAQSHRFLAAMLASGAYGCDPGAQDVRAPATDVAQPKRDPDERHEDPTRSDTDVASQTGVCGNGLVEADEACDLGFANGWAPCTPACTLPTCGDGFVAPDEACDPGVADGPPCDSTCEAQAHSYSALPRSSSSPTHAHRSGSGDHPTLQAPIKSDPIAPRPDTVFLNFGGAALAPPPPNALNQRACVTIPFNYPAFSGDDRDVEAVAQTVRQWLEPLDVRVVTTAPPDYLPYTMVMIGGDPSALRLAPGVRGYACAIDCSDTQRGDVAFVFSEISPSNNEVARTAAHEVAHLWGLDHVDANDLMHAIAFPSDPELRDECLPLDLEPPPRCSVSHAQFCPPGQQNLLRELKAIIGPRTVDHQPPRVEIVTPVEGGAYVAGQPLEISTEIDDDKPLFGWGFSVPGLQWSQPAWDAQMELGLFFPPGKHTLAVEATDQAGHRTARAVSFVVYHPDDPRGWPSPTPTDPVEPVAKTSLAPPPGVGNAPAAAGCRWAAPSRTRWLGLLAFLGRCRRRRPKARA